VPRNKTLQLILFARKNEIFPSDMVKPSLVLFATCCAFCFCALSVFISSSVVFAATLFVGPGGYPTIQAAITAASNPGDTVIVAAGTYYENIIFRPGKTITLVSENGAASTVIDGGNSGTVVTFAPGSNSTLDGFKITNGTAENGGGVLVSGCSETDPANCVDITATITNCIITGNQASAGGGISCGRYSKPVITNSIIKYNSATGSVIENNGGGIHAAEGAKLTISNCAIHNNRSDQNGGGLAFNDADEPRIVNCVFSDNSAEKSGGAISFQNSTPIITNCTFSNNSASENGGAISFDTSAPIITNCTFSNSSASGNGGAIACTNPLPETTVANSILWGDDISRDEIACDSEISVTYSDIQGGYTGEGNINADPMFVDQANGDFHLQEDSPCIDAGDNSAPALPATDIDGDDRKMDDPAVDDTGNGTSPIVDMGADEYYLSSPTVPLPSATIMPLMLLLSD
jgi:predicted outer membrane repeat protein